MISSTITWCGQTVTLACDGQCAKAWGVCQRPRVQLSDDPDDMYLIPDGELGEAPADPGTYEGDHAKPATPSHNKWCARQCERSVSVKPGESIQLPDLCRPLYNQPWKHPEAGLQG